MTQEGRIQPSVATMAPGTEANCMPTKVAALMAMGPGVISAMVMRSVKLFQGQPGVKLYGLRLDQGERGVTASDAE